MKHLKALNQYFWKYKFRLTIGILFVVVSNYFGVLAPQITSYIIEFVQRVYQLPGYKPRSQAAHYDVLVQKFITCVETFSATKVVALAGIVILVLAILRGFFMFLMRQTLIVMSRHIEYDQKNEVYAHYQRMDAAFFKAHSTGDLMSRMAEDVSKVRMFTGPAVMYVVNLITLISLAVYFMFMQDATLTLYVLMPLPVLAVIIYFVNTIIHKRSEKLQAALASLTSNAQQSYAGIRVIKSFVQEDAMLDYFKEKSEEYKKQAVTLAKIEAVYFPSMTLFIGLSTLLTIMIGGIYYIHGTHNISISTIVEFVIYINLMTFPVSAIGATASMIQRASASQKRLNEFLQTKPSIHNQEQTIKEKIRGDIDFDSVDFVYANTGIQALKNFTLSIKAGQKVAIVGRTGSGKSTVAQMLLRMYNPDAGLIKIDQRLIQDYDLHSLRDQISYVPQDGFLFSDTIERNISFSTATLNKDDIQKAAELAVVKKEIESFPNQYQTMIGERGVTLSGGQKQRVSIARALLKNAPIIILDDCLSAVDARTEKEILSNLNQYLNDKTAIIITHRIFSLLSFDKIIVMDAGSIAEEGTHLELLQKRGLYAEMYMRQLREDTYPLEN
ncbi:MAG: ABC transporter [Chitinophagaceae bacterium]